MKLIIINNTKINCKDDFQMVKDYFASRLPFPLEFDFIDSNIQGLQTELFTGTKYWGLRNGKDLIRVSNLVEKFKYQICIFIHGEIVKDIAHWNSYAQLLPDTEWIEIAATKEWDKINDIFRVATHEIIHAFCKRAGRAGKIVLDELDKTKEGVEYLDEFNVFSPVGNRTRTLKNLQGSWDFVLKNPYKGYKYFKPNEVSGLKDELVQKLDGARELAHIPFVITSGLRSPEHNTEVGGVEGSEHITGEGCDLRVRNSHERFLILNSALKVGFNRIGLYPKHIHLGVSKSNPQEVVWI